jgi:predicted nucleic acid-binding protein
LASVYWDTNLFIYLLEGRGELNHRVKEIRRGMLERGDRFYTGSITVGEVLVGPVMKGLDDVEEQYLEFFTSSAVEIVQFDLKAAPHYARIRLDRSIGPADAIQLACAAAAEVDMFITNDERLSRKRVPGIKFIVNLANAPT